MKLRANELCPNHKSVEKALVIEMPQLGHATYVFAKPRSMEGFLGLYTRITKDDIRRNRNNVGERLGILGARHPRRQSKSMAQGDAATPGGEGGLCLSATTEPRTPPGSDKVRLVRFGSESTCSTQLCGKGRAEDEVT